MIMSETYGSQQFVFTNKHAKKFSGELMMFQMVDILAFCLFWAGIKFLHIFVQHLDIPIVMENNLVWGAFGKLGMYGQETSERVWISTPVEKNTCLMITKCHLKSKMFVSITKFCPAFCCQFKPLKKAIVICETSV